MRELCRYKTNRDGQSGRAAPRGDIHIRYSRIAIANQIGPPERAKPTAVLSKALDRNLKQDVNSPNVYDVIA
jgi:hypothetical protein